MSGRPIDAVLARLRKLKPNGDRSWLACCPAHDDHNPSLSVSVGDDGRVLFHCFAGCSSDDVRAALGLEWRDLHAEPIEDARRGTRPPRAAHGTPRHDDVPTTDTTEDDPEPTTPTGHVFASLDEVRTAYRRRFGEPAATWTYRDAGGDVVGAVLRWNTAAGKTFRQAWRFDDGWRMKKPQDKKQPLYRLNTLATEDRVFVVEGEKAADRLASLGYVVTTSPGGSKAAERAEWSTLTASEVVIVPDADDAGEAYAAAVTEQLAAPDREVVTLRLPGLRPRSGEDVVEWIENVHHGDEDAAVRSLEELAAEAVWSARRRRPVVSIIDVIDDPAWSKPPEIFRTGVPWYDGIQPFGGIERGTLTVIAGPPGCGKTAVMQFLAWRAAEAGHRVCYIAGEMDRQKLGRRIVANMAEVSPNVVRDPPTEDVARRVEHARHRLHEFGERLQLRNRPITPETIGEAAATCDIVVVDYLQLITTDRGGSSRVDELDHAMREVVALTQDGATIVAAASMNRSDRDTASMKSIKGTSEIEYGATTVYATTTAASIDPSQDGSAPARVTVEFRCLKQREGAALPLRFDLWLPLGPLPVEPRL